MTSSLQRPSILSYLAREPIGRIWKKDILGRPYVLLLPFIVTGLGLYTMGIAIGHARRAKFEILLSLSYDTPPQRGELESLTNDLVNLIRGRLGSYRESYAKEPDSLSGLFIKTELKDNGLSFELPPKSFEKAAKRKLLLETESGPLFVAESFILEGIAFGASFPELTERMWNSSSETDLTERQEWRTRGLDIPEQPEPITLEEAERIFLPLVAVYVSQYHPQLMKPLGLKLS